MRAEPTGCVGGAVSASDIAVALQKLTKSFGAYRPDLVVALRGELIELQRCWSIPLVIEDPTAAQSSVQQNLAILVNQLEPRPAKQRGLSPSQRKKQYRHAIGVYFNLKFPNIPEYVDLRTMTLTGRRQWLAEEARGALKVSVSAGQDDLTDAIKKLTS